MVSRTNISEDQFELSKKANVPGPGSYTHRLKNVENILSNFKHSGSPVMRKESHDRFYTNRNSIQTPGPGNYTLKDDIGSGTGKYVLSTT